jgi:hypothetical protein
VSKTKICQAATFLLTTTQRREPYMIDAWVRQVLRGCPLLVDWAWPVAEYPQRRTSQVTLRLLLVEGTTESQINEFLRNIESVVAVERTEEWTPYIVGRNYSRGEFMLRGY